MLSLQDDLSHRKVRQKMISEKLSKDQNGQRKWIETERLSRKREFEKRLENYHKMIERDCYGIKKNKV